MSTLTQTIKNVAKTFDRFTERAGGLKMYPYQSEPAKAILDSILNKRGLTFVVIISRQAGKDELFANFISYLLNLYAHREKGIVVANPTYKPQTLNFIMRLENRLAANLLTKTQWKKRSDYMRMIGKAVVSLLSADSQANVVGATASLLLVINEAQDISILKYDKDFEPMTASTNATRVIVGTEWTSNTLLAREEDHALALQKKDGIRRLFKYTADDVRKVNKAYGKFVDEKIKQLGREHPLVKTQYFCERIDAIAGMFNARRLALMQGDQPAHTEPQAGHNYAMTIDVAGVDEAMLELDGLGNPGRDKTTADMIDIDLSQLDILQAPIYRNMQRTEWHGENHVTIFGALCSQIDRWNPKYIIIDATGVGEGLYSMLFKKYPTKTIGVKFSAQVKSEIGYAYLGIIEAGRFRDCAGSQEVTLQYQNCTSEILIGPQKTMRWGVKDGTRGPSGELLHDDCILADSLVTELDKLDWYIQTDTEIISIADPIEEMSRSF